MGLMEPSLRLNNFLFSSSPWVLNALSRSYCYRIMFSFLPNTYLPLLSNMSLATVLLSLPLIIFPNASSCMFPLGSTIMLNYSDVGFSQNKTSHLWFKVSGRTEWR